MSITKLDLINHLMAVLGLPKGEAKHLVELFFEEIAMALEKGENVKLSGFGHFRVRYKKERLGRNPKTGQDKPISARRVVTFKPSQKLRVQAGKRV